MTQGARPFSARKWLGRATLPFYAALVLLFLQVPVIVVILASLTETSYLTVPPKGLSLKWYFDVLQDASYLKAITFSTVLALVSTFLSLAIGTAASYALIRPRGTGGRFHLNRAHGPAGVPGRGDRRCPASILYTNWRQGVFWRACGRSRLDYGAICGA